MKATTLFLTFLIGVIVGVAGHWYMTQPKQQEMLTNARQDISASSEKAGQTIKHETKKATEAVADATANARTTAAIKTKLVADSGLSAFKIDVDTTDGVVTLSGTVSSPEAITQAMKLAMEVEGVKHVVSTLIVKPSN